MTTQNQEENKSGFKSGDQVRLKSGGPDMTVSNVSDLGDVLIECHWFGGKKLEYGRFHPGELVKVQAEDKPLTAESGKTKGGA